jgi:S-adenosylmethionine/arginine decarboxylase-like enzyme
MGHGRHVKVVGYGAAGLLGSVDVVRTLLKDLVAALGMRPLGEPVMHDVDIDLSKLGGPVFEDEGGVTGTIVLSTSHCAIHTWPAREKPFFVMDVYSCRDFEPDTVRRMLEERVGLTSARFTDITDALLPPVD